MSFKMNENTGTSKVERQELLAPTPLSRTSKLNDNLQTVQPKYTRSLRNLDLQKIDFGPVLEVGSCLEKAVRKNQFWVNFMRSISSNFQSQVD